MTRVQILFIMVSLSVLATACRNGHHTVIKTSDGHHSQRIEYSGQVVFNSDNGIDYMSPRSYLKYNNDQDELEINCDKAGRITYELNDGSATNVLDEEGKQLLTEAVKEIVKRKAKH